MNLTENEYILEINCIEKKYPGFQLSDVSFKLPKGYIMGLIGPNGAGKTTIINLIMNLAKKDKGEISLFGKFYKHNEKKIHEKIGFVYEIPQFYSNLKLKQTASVIAQFYNEWDHIKFNSLCQSFDIDTGKKFRELSKGARMKFSIAIALSHNAELLVLDEPTSGLDPVFRAKFLDMLSEFLMNENRSVLYSTHITSDLEKNCDYITYIRNGRLIFSVEKDIISDTWGIIRMPADSEDIVSPDILGKKVFRNHKEFLSINIKNTENLLKGRVVIEKPSLERVMVLMDEGDSNVKNS